MKTSSALPLPDFIRLYQDHLGAADRPSCYIAYCRAEADMERDHGRRRYANFHTFHASMWRHVKKVQQKALSPAY